MAIIQKKRVAKRTPAPSAQPPPGPPSRVSKPLLITLITIGILIVLVFGFMFYSGTFVGKAFESGVVDTGGSTDATAFKGGWADVSVWVSLTPGKSTLGTSFDMQLPDTLSCDNVGHLIDNLDSTLDTKPSPITGCTGNVIHFEQSSLDSNDAMSGEFLLTTIHFIELPAGEHHLEFDSLYVDDFDDPGRNAISTPPLGSVISVGAVCGDGAIEGDEQCEGEDLAGQSCTSQGYLSGSLGCSDECQFDTSQCVPACTSDADCTDPAAPACNTATGACVECTSDPHCTDPSEPFCDVDTFTCVGCNTDADCEGIQVCDPTGMCTNPDAECGNNVIEDFAGETCDDGNAITESCAEGESECTVCGESCTWTGGTVLDYCGDGHVTELEVCDDGNNVGGDGCPADCTGDFYRCEVQPSASEDGLGYDLSMSEQVMLVDEEGSPIPDGFGDRCLTSETLRETSCITLEGGFYESYGEASANLVAKEEVACPSGLCADNACAPAANCGDSIVQFGEECDYGDTDDGDGCSSACMFEEGWDCDATGCTEHCGDNLIVGDEVCDGTNVNGQSCEDHGFDLGFLGCSSACDAFDTSQCVHTLPTAICGDNIVGIGEECDYGDILDGDGCSSTCQIEPGWSCDLTGCSENCGDKLVVGSEECDSGAASNGVACTHLPYGGSCDYCSDTCTTLTITGPHCGDGELEALLEECDGANLNGATCTSQGFTGGDLSCDAATCEYDVSSCTSGCVSDADCLEDQQCDIESGQCTDDDDYDDKLDFADVVVNGVSIGTMTQLESFCVVVPTAPNCDTIDTYEYQLFDQTLPASFEVKAQVENLYAALDTNPHIQDIKFLGTHSGTLEELPSDVRITDLGPGQIEAWQDTFTFSETIDDGEYFLLFAEGTDDLGIEHTKMAVILVNVDTGERAICGNGIHETGEECDGSDFGGKTCITEGFAGGSLICNGVCLINTDSCDPGVTSDPTCVETMDDLLNRLSHGDTICNDRLGDMNDLVSNPQNEECLAVYNGVPITNDHFLGSAKKKMNYLQLNDAKTSINSLEDWSSLCPGLDFTGWNEASSPGGAPYYFPNTREQAYECIDAGTTAFTLFDLSQCQECTDDSHCQEGETCTNNICVEDGLVISGEGTQREALLRSIMNNIDLPDGLSAIALQYKEYATNVDDDVPFTITVDNQRMYDLLLEVKLITEDETINSFVRTSRIARALRDYLFVPPVLPL